MSKSIVVDRVKIIAEMARQNLTGEELAQKAGVGHSAVIKMRKGQPVWRTTAGHVAAGMAKSTMTARMKGYQPWTSDEITRVAAVLNIPREQIGEFFFEPLPGQRKGA